MPEADFNPNEESNFLPRPEQPKYRPLDGFDELSAPSVFSGGVPRATREVIQKWGTELQQILTSKLWDDFEDKVEELKYERGMSPDTRELIINMPVPGIEAPGFLFAYLQQCTDAPHMRTLENFLKMGADLNAKNKQGETIVDVLLRTNPSLELLGVLVEAGAEFREQDHMYAVQESMRAPTMTGREFIPYLAKLSKHLHIEGSIEKELNDFLKVSSNLSHAYAYIKAFEEVVSESPLVQSQAHPGTAFLNLTRLVLYHYEPPMIRELIYSIEHFMDCNPHLHGWHQSEVELALLLNHPELEYQGLRDPDVDGATKNKIRESIGVANTITRAITSPHRVWFSNTANLKNISPEGTEAVRTIGLLSHSFRFLRYETEQARILNGEGEEFRVPGSSLLEKFGFDRIPDRRTDGPNFFFHSDKRHPGFGAGYLLHPSADIWKEPTLKNLEIEPGTWIEFRQGYLLASNEDGTLVIRNSSPTFGRNGLKHFAYWSRFSVGEGLSESDILLPEADLFTNQTFDSIFSESNFRDAITENPSIYRLSQVLLKLKNAVKDWEFDTRQETAWSKNETTGDLYVNGSGHHFSDGFRHVVDFLRAKASHNEDLLAMGKEPQPLPDLSFFNRYLPAWMPESFSLPVDGGQQEQSRLIVTPKVLELLHKLAYYEFRDSDQAASKATGLEAFLSVGVENQSQLVMVAPSRIS
ncbi:MAG: hypothetical protein ACO3XO_01915 [Bdellovibrionota bacterium]